jgi:hypothetical protein
MTILRDFCSRRNAAPAKPLDDLGVRLGVQVADFAGREAPDLQALPRCATTGSSAGSLPLSARFSANRLDDAEG